MKKLILIASLFLVGCETSNITEHERVIMDNMNYRIYELEGCEYIVMGYGDQKWGSHKGNCKNPIHINH
jgi:hypothetical protein